MTSSLYFTDRVATSLRGKADKHRKLIEGLEGLCKAQMKILEKIEDFSKVGT